MEDDVLIVLAIPAAFSERDATARGEITRVRAKSLAESRVSLERLLPVCRLLLGLAAPALLAYAAVQLLGRYWAWLAILAGSAYLVMLAVTFAAILLYLWFGLPGELDVHAPLCDEKGERCAGAEQDREGATGGEEHAVGTIASRPF